MGVKGPCRHAIQLSRLWRLAGSVGSKEKLSNLYQTLPASLHLSPESSRIKGPRLLKLRP